MAIALKLPYYQTQNIQKYQQFQLEKLHRELTANHNVRTPVKCRDNDCDNRDYYDDYDNEDDDNDDIYIMMKCLSVCHVFAYFAFPLPS